MTQSVPTFRKPIDKEANAMASNEVEVLDPAPTVEKLKKFASERVLNRRHFIAALGVAGAAAAGTELVRSGPTALAQQPKPSGYAQVDVLNFLLNIKYLKATLYSYITQGADLPAADFANLGSGGIFNPPAKITFTAAGPASATEITDLFNAMYYDELNELVALRALLGALASSTGGAGDAVVANRPTLNLLGTGPTTTTSTQTVTPLQAISILRMLEDLSAAAFAGSTIYLTGTNLQYATQALAVNGFHAGALRLISIQSGAPYYGPQYLTSPTVSTQTQNSVSASIVAGSTTIYFNAPTNPITVGSIITSTSTTGTNVPPNTVVTAVNPPTVYTGTLTGTSTVPNNVITNVTPVTGLVTGMALSGTGIPANAIITNITGTTVTIGTITGYSAQVPSTPPFTSGTPITNGIVSVAYSNGSGTAVGMTPGTYALTFTGGGGSGAAGKITVLTPGTTAVPAQMYLQLSSSGSGYITAPTVTAPTGGTPPTFTANVAAQITTSATGVVLAPGFIAATTKSTGLLTYVSQTAGLIPGQLVSGTAIPASAAIAQGGINAAAGTVLLQTSGGTTTLSASATNSVAPTGTVTKGTSVITNVSSVSGILLGMPITGTGIPAGTTVTSFDPTGLTILMSTTATATTPPSGTSSVTPSAFLTLGSNVVTALSSLSGLATGDTVSGTGIQTGTTITGVGGINTATLSLPATATTVTTTGTTSPVNAILQSGNNIVQYVYPIPNGLATGQLITDSQGNIPSGTTITGVSAAGFNITLSAPATGATTVTAVTTFTGTITVGDLIISSVSSFSGLAVGQPITGPNIPYGTVITAINSTANPPNLTISQVPSAAAGPQLVGASLSILSTTTLSSVTIQKITVLTPAGTVPSTEALTIPTVEVVTESLGTATLSQAATTTGTQTLIYMGTDNQDVEPADPGTITFAGIVTSGSAAVTQISVTGLAVGMLVGGPGIPAGATIATIVQPTSTTTGTITLSASATAGSTTAITLAAYLPNAAALAAKGPTAIAGTSPSVYGGFFDTAGGATLSANNPAGSTFARTFSQVLAALYANTTPQTYQGGFFPNGVGGNINVV
jgi:hypothetical protein